jgi:hypothetical protein
VVFKLFSISRHTKQFFHILWKGQILTVWKGKFWQFGKGNFDSL